MLATAATAKPSMHSRLPVPVRSGQLREGCPLVGLMGGSMRFTRNTEVYGEDGGGVQTSPPVSLRIGYADVRPLFDRHGLLKRKARPRGPG
jgi:hypothetical protein